MYEDSYRGKAVDAVLRPAPYEKGECVGCSKVASLSELKEICFTYQEKQIEYMEEGKLHRRFYFKADEKIKDMINYSARCSMLGLGSKHIRTDIKFTGKERLSKRIPTWPHKYVCNEECFEFWKLKNV